MDILGMANDLNKQKFKENDISENSYYKIHGESTFELKEKIENEIYQKFNEQSKILDKVDWGNPYSYVLYSMLKKEFNYLEKFQVLSDKTFGDSTQKVKYFGLDASTVRDAEKNVYVLFYNSKEDFGVKLRTKEGEEVILYRTNAEGKSFEDIYNEIIEKEKEYKGNRELEENDTLKIPFIKVSSEINYDELCGRMIKGTDIYIRQALQTVDFELNDVGRKFEK